MDTSTQHLVDFAMDTSFQSLGSSTVHECKRRLIDTFACTLGAYNDPLSVSMRRLAADYSGKATASIWGSTQESTPEMAAFANGVMLRALDLNDTFLALGGAHPSDIISGLVAVAESSGADGKALIRATVVGYEVCCRFMESVNLNTKGWDMAVPGVLATALGAGLLLGLSHKQMGHAVSLALIPNIALRQTRHGEPSNWRSCAGANASRNAVFAALLARDGMEGPSDVFEGKQGLWSILGPFALPPRATLNSTQMISSTHMKILPVCYHDQSAALCALELRHRVSPDEIAEIECASYKIAVEMTGSDPTRWAPGTRETADHSMPFIVASALVHGAVTISSFDPERLGDPRVANVMNKVKVVADPALSAMWPSAAPTRLTVRTRSGQSITVETLYPKGHLRDPLSDEALNAKFGDLYGQHGPASARAAALRALWAIDSATDIRKVVRTLAVSS